MFVYQRVVGISMTMISNKPIQNLWLKQLKPGKLTQLTGHALETIASPPMRKPRCTATSSWIREILLGENARTFRFWITEQHVFMHMLWGMNRKWCQVPLLQFLWPIVNSDVFWDVQGNVSHMEWLVKTISPIESTSRQHVVLWLLSCASILSVQFTNHVPIA